VKGEGVCSKLGRLATQPLREKKEAQDLERYEHGKEDVANEKTTPILERANGDQWTNQRKKIVIIGS